MPIPVYTPALSVLLTRLVSRTGGNASPATQPFRQVDLTPYLGNAGVVRTIKDINQPAGGFTITFADRLNPDFGDTMYALIEPMDMIEIRASRTPQDYIGTPLPLIMRGFVSAIERAESMGQDGTPMRTVTVSGQDSGKLWLINHVYFETLALTDDGYLLTFHLQTATGISVAPLPVNEFMSQIVSRVINPKIQQLSAFADAQVQPFTLDASVPDGIVLPNLVAGFDQIAIWQLADAFADRPWNELFVLDYEEGPHLVFRPAPYRDLSSGNFIINGAVDPGTIDLDIADVVAMTMGRSDSRVANFFWVPPGVSQLDSNGLISTAALQARWPFDFAYDNNNPILFGLRKMTAQSTLYPQSIASPMNMLPPGAQPGAIGAAMQWYQARGAQLQAMNRDNAAMEEGGMVVKGSEGYIIGHELQLTRGAIVATAYLTQVGHTFAPLQVWTSSLHVIRGTGFYERNRIAAGDPYIMEGARGPYSP